jgi:hypothetical protein
MNIMVDYEKLREQGYGGKIIATEFFNSLEVLASGDTLGEVSKLIDKSKFPKAYIFYLPKKDESFIFPNVA